MKPIVLFITKTCYLDAALEYIDEVKKFVTLHVIIEIDPFSKKMNISDVNNLPEKITFIEAKQLLSQKEYLNYKKYMDGCASFEFLIHQNNKSISLVSIKKSYLLFKKTKKIVPDYIHFDDVSIRLILFPFLVALLKTKLIINVHDPIQHSGEKNLKNIFARKIFYKKVSKFITFSKFSKSIFIENNKKKFCVNLNLKPYLFYLNYLNKNDDKKTKFSFIGRISAYKGIDIFLDAISILNNKYNNISYLIAGAPFNDTIGEKLVNQYQFENVEFKLKHLSNLELCNIIQESKIIVCPYRDATQSGVVMTALALNTPLIVSNQGGLPEYIEENITGMIANADAVSIAAAIETFIIDPFKHLKLSEKIKNMDKAKFMIGESKILNLYSE
jgi:glycosyltransferase involved in cell wall biosynthesis